MSEHQNLDDIFDVPYSLDNFVPVISIEAQQDASESYFEQHKAAIESEAKLSTKTVKGIV